MLRHHGPGCSVTNSLQSKVYVTNTASLATPSVDNLAILLGIAQMLECLSQHLDQMGDHPQHTHWNPHLGTGLGGLNPQCNMCYSAILGKSYHRADHHIKESALEGISPRQQGTGR